MSTVTIVNITDKTQNLTNGTDSISIPPRAQEGVDSSYLTFSNSWQGKIVAISDIPAYTPPTPTYHLVGGSGDVTTNVAVALGGGLTLTNVDGVLTLSALNYNTGLIPSGVYALI